MDHPAIGSSGASVLARRPEIVPVAATVLAWAALIADSPTAGWSATGNSIAGHGAHGGVFTASGVAMVAAMTVAMMGPLAVPGARGVARRVPTCPNGAILGFFAAFVLTWTVIALCLATVAETLGGVLGSPVVAAGVLTLGCAVAQFDPRRRDALGACERQDQHGNTSGPVVDAARFGMSCAARGFRLCALPMLAMLALPGSLPFMMSLTVLVTADRYTEGRHRVVVAALYSVLGVGLLGVGLLL
jgi:hypothetical protein